MLPYPDWRMLPGSGQPIVDPSISCTDCGFHAIVWAGEPERDAAIGDVGGHCCEEHFPSEAMTAEERAEHVCPNCSWSPSDENSTSKDRGSE